MELVVKSSSSETEVHHLFHLVERLCPVSRTLEAAGIKITNNIAVRE